MATLHIASAADKAKAQRIGDLIDNGTKCKPPELQGKANECAKCHKMTMFARFYIPKIGYCDQECFDDWRTTPAWCSTRADEVHVGRVHIPPIGIFDLYNDAYAKRQASANVKSSAAAERPQDGPRDAQPASHEQSWVERRVAQIKDIRGRESCDSEQRWHDARNAGYAKRGNVMVMPWRMTS